MKMAMLLSFLALSGISLASHFKSNNGMCDLACASTGLFRVANVACQLRPLLAALPSCVVSQNHAEYQLLQAEIPACSRIAQIFAKT